MVCNRKVITGHAGKQVPTGLLTLIAVHYMYELEYNQIMYFMQEKLLGDPLPATQKVSQVYSTLFRSIGCIENTLGSEFGDHVMVMKKHRLSVS